MNRDLLEDFELTHGSQRRTEEPEAWQRYLDEKCQAPEPVS